MKTGLPERLKKFTIPKRTPNKGFLSDRSTNQRDCQEVQERLTQSCFDRECNLASLWHFEKIDMVHNKDLEEEFVAKRTKMREQGRMDKELSSFLVVSKEEVLQICQSGLRTSNSIKKELHIMRELGNPQFGVYLFRHVDIALNYASKHSVPIENIIIFRVLLGKVKNIHPPKGKKKHLLDPTPNYDCHIARIQPSLKDSVEDQAIGSLVYFYEYGELSKPVDKPRQCLPHAVVKVKCINQKARADYPVVSLKSRPNRVSKGRGRGPLLENCTIVTRIGNSQLIYEHFHKPKNCAVSDNLSVKSSESAPNWNGSGAETQGSKMKHKLPGQWDSAQVEADVQNFQRMPDVDCDRDGKSNHMGSFSKNPNDTSVNYSKLSTIITSKSIKDPRLAKKERNLGEQNGEPISHGIVQLENELKYKTEMKMATTFGIPWPDPEELFLLNDSWRTFSEEQYTAKTPWKERVLGERGSPLSSNNEYWVNNEHTGVDVNLDSQNIDTDFAVKSNLSHSSLKSADCGIKTASQSFAQRDKTVKYSDPLLGQNENSVNTDCAVSSYISNGTCTHDREQLVLAPPFQINAHNRDLERAAADRDERSVGDQVHAEVFKQNKLRELAHTEKSRMDEIPEKTNRQISPSSNRTGNIGEKEENTSKKLENVKDWMDTSRILDSENSASDFNLNFQLSALLTKCTGPTTEDTAFMLLASTPAPLGYVKDTEIEHPQSEKTSHATNEQFGVLNNSLSCNDTMPEIFEQVLAVKSRDINTPDLEVNSKAEFFSEGDKKCSSVPQKRCSHVEVSSDDTDTEYQYLQERMDWENLLAKSTPDTEISGSTSLKEDKNECSCEEKIEAGGKAEKMFNMYVKPDLQITVPNTVYPCHSPLKMRTEMGKFVTKCSEQKTGFKWSQEKKKGKYILSQKKPRLYHRKKALHTHCSSETAPPLSKGPFEQSEKHIKNVLHTLNTEASLCKNKHLSQKINGAMFHLQKAQRSVQKSLKILAMTGKKKRKNDSGSHKTIPSNLCERSDHASCNVVSVKKMAACFAGQQRPKIGTLTSPIEAREAGEKTNCQLEGHIESEGGLTCSTTSFLNDNETHSGSLSLDCSVTSAFTANMPCSNDNMKVRVIDHEISERSTSSDAMELDMKPASGESRVNSEQRTYANVVSENNIQEHFTPLMGHTKQELSSEASKHIATSKNISKCLNLAIGTEELSLCHADQGADEDARESNVNTSTVKLAASVQKSSGKLKPSKPDDISKFPIFSGKDTFSNEKEAVEISPVQQKNISPNVDSDLSHALVPVVKNMHDARDPQVLLTPQIHGSGWKIKANNSSERNLEDICSEKQEEQQKLYENNKHKLLAKPIIQPENNMGILNGYLMQTSQVTHSKESTNKWTLPSSTEKVGRCHSASPLRGDSKEGVITATMILPCAYDNVLPNKNYQKDKGLSSEHSNNRKNITNGTKLQVEIEQTALDFIMEISMILQKADETSCLNVLQEQVTICKNVLPLFIRAFEEKQDCSFEHVLVSRENAKKSMRAKLKPYAIESFVELQIIMETIEFLENKRRYLQDKRTFRSLLWFDDSLCIELFGGQSGYQQQSNFYPAFQRSLKYSALNELQSHHKELVDKFEITRLENKSYYCLLKLRREIKECESVVKSNFLLSEFFLSEPYVCGANYGDTVEDLENARKSTVDLINTCSSLSGIPLGTEKLEHLGIIMDIISTKVEFIRTCKERKINSSFIGLEHIFFNAAVSCILRERSIFVNGDFKSGDGQMLKIYEAALPKLYEIYEDRVEELESNFNCASGEHTRGANYGIRNYLVSYPEICVGEILDEAQSVNLEKLRQHLCRCTEHLEVLKKYFQIIQEVDVDRVLITKENVLSFMESNSLSAIRLKPEAVEVYMDLAMVHETLCFLQNSIARKEDKPRFRSLLWWDLSLINELFHCQQKMASFSYQKDNPLEITESAISDLHDELNVVYDYAESLNCSYARQLLTKELEELLETRKYLQTSVSSICMCIDLVPYTIALNYGSNISELEYNYEQFYSLFEKLLLADRKDLGKMAHVMKILKTIEHMKFICTKQQKPPLHLVICQMLKNWRKSRRLKKQEDMNRHMDSNGGNSTKHKRPAGITSEDNSCDHEEQNDPSDSKKKKVVAASTTPKKKQEKESRRNVRKGARPKPLEREELQVKSSTDNTWNKKDKCFRDQPSLSPSHSKGLKAADSLDYIELSPNVSSPTLANSNMLDSQKNQTDLEDFTNNRRGCSKGNNQECFASCNERGKDTFVSPKKDLSPQNSPEDSFTSVAKLSHDSPVLPTPNQCYVVKPDVTGNASGLTPRGCTTVPLELDRNGEMYETKSEPTCALAYNSDSSAIPELNEFVELESLCSDPFSTENTHASAECSAFSQNEHIEETPHIHSYSVHTYRTFYPSYSWYFCQTGSSYQATQMYQEFSSYAMHQLTPTMLTATGMVYNTQSSYSHSCSHFGVGESQRFNFAQSYPAQSYFNSTVSFPYSYQQWPSWYAETPPAAQAAYPYSSNPGL